MLVAFVMKCPNIFFSYINGWTHRQPSHNTFGYLLLSWLTVQKWWGDMGGYTPSKRCSCYEYWRDVEKIQQWKTEGYDPSSIRYWCKQVGWTLQFTSRKARNQLKNTFWKVEAREKWRPSQSSWLKKLYFHAKSGSEITVILVFGNWW